MSKLYPDTIVKSKRFFLGERVGVFSSLGLYAIYGSMRINGFLIDPVGFLIDRLQRAHETPRGLVCGPRVKTW